MASGSGGSSPAPEPQRHVRRLDRLLHDEREVGARASRARPARAAARRSPRACAARRSGAGRSAGRRTAARASAPAGTARRRRASRPAIARFEPPRERREQRLPAEHEPDVRRAEQHRERAVDERPRDQAVDVVEPVLEHRDPDGDGKLRRSRSRRGRRRRSAPTTLGSDDGEQRGTTTGEDHPLHLLRARPRGSGGSGRSRTAPTAERRSDDSDDRGAGGRCRRALPTSADPERVVRQLRCRRRAGPAGRMNADRDHGDEADQRPRARAASAAPARARSGIEERHDSDEDDGRIPDPRVEPGRGLRPRHRPGRRSSAVATA